MTLPNTIEAARELSDFINPKSITTIQQEMRKFAMVAAKINRNLESDDVKKLIATFISECQTLNGSTIEEHNVNVPPASHNMKIISGKNFVIHLRRDVQNRKWVFGFTIHRT